MPRTAYNSSTFTEWLLRATPWAARIERRCRNHIHAHNPAQTLGTAMTLLNAVVKQAKKGRTRIVLRRPDGRGRDAEMDFQDIVNAAATAANEAQS